MSDWEDLFPSSVATSVTEPIPNIVDVVDLRREFDNLVLGSHGETPIGRTFILRRMRRDSEDNLVPCICLDDFTKEPDRDSICPFCIGSGYLFDEELVTAYMVVSAAPSGSNAAANFPKMKPGTMYVPSARFFLSYDVNPRREDRIVELELDSEGNPVTPYNRVAIYEFMLIRALRADDGRIEYWTCTCQKMGPTTQGLVS
jgi:hypothetical protein